jgi:hypothetical protein
MDKKSLSITHVHNAPCDICEAPGALKIETLDIDPIEGTESSRFSSILILCLEHWNWLVLNGISAEVRGSSSTRLPAVPSEED